MVCSAAVQLLRFLNCRSVLTGWWCHIFGRKWCTFLHYPGHRTMEVWCMADLYQEEPGPPSCSDLWGSPPSQATSCCIICLSSHLFVQLLSRLFQLNMVHEIQKKKKRVRLIAFGFGTQILLWTLLVRFRGQESCFWLNRDSMLWHEQIGCYNRPWSECSRILKAPVDYAWRPWLWQLDWSPYFVEVLLNSIILQ